MSVHVTLDSGLLAVPVGITTAEHTRRFADGLLEWCALLDEPWAEIFMSEGASAALVEDRCFPDHSIVGLLLRQHGIVEYSANDLIAVVGRLISMAQSFEEDVGMWDVLLEDGAVVASPDVLQLAAGICSRACLGRCLVCLAVQQGYCSGGAAQHVLVLRRAPATCVRVGAQVHALDHERDDLRPLPEPPDCVEGTVRTCDCLSDLVRCLDEVALLRWATDDAGVELACRVAVLRARDGRREKREWGSVDRGQVGSLFREKAQRCCRDASEDFPGKLLRAVAHTVDGENLGATRWLRVDRGANSAQRRRGSDHAMAWRRDIDNEYRLHYWQLPSGRVELAWVASHNDLYIPD